jgi:hypothetical protein
MDALVALGFTSFLGAAGFTATGYFLARSGLVGKEEPREEPKEAPRAAPATEPPPPSVAPAPARTPVPPPTATIEIEMVTPEQPSVRHLTPAPRASAPPSPSQAPKRDPRREDDSEPRLSTAAATVPPPDDEIERQLGALRSALRTEARGRDQAEAHAKELEVRLGAMTERILVLEARQRDSMKPRRDTPRSMAPPRSGTSQAPGRERLASLAPGLFAELEELKATVARLTAENEALKGGE